MWSFVLEYPTIFVFVSLSSLRVSPSPCFSPLCRCLWGVALILVSTLGTCCFLVLVLLCCCNTHATLPSVWLTSWTLLSCSRDQQLSGCLHERHPPRRNHTWITGVDASVCGLSLGYVHGAFNITTFDVILWGSRRPSYCQEHCRNSWTRTLLVFTVVVAFSVCVNAL